MEVFTTYYSKLVHLDFKTLYPYLVTARIISHNDVSIVQDTVGPSKVASHILGKISASLQGGTDTKFDGFLSILVNHHDSFCTSLAKQMRSDLLKNTTGTVCMVTLYCCCMLYFKYIAATVATVEQPSYQAVENPHEESAGH